jgi:hypothetical protein
MRLPRFRLRTLMVAVAVVGIPLGLYIRSLKGDQSMMSRFSIYELANATGR